MPKSSKDRRVSGQAPVAGVDAIADEAPKTTAPTLKPPTPEKAMIVRLPARAARAPKAEKAPRPRKRA